MTPADYAEALERAADFAESEDMHTGPDDTRIDTQALRALAKALREALACVEFNSWAPENEYVIELP